MVRKHQREWLLYHLFSWRTILTNICCASRPLMFFMHRNMSWNHGRKNDWAVGQLFFILAEQLNAWHSYHHFQRYLFHEDRLQVSFLNSKTKHTFKRNMMTTYVFISATNIISYVTAPKNNSSKVWLYNLSTAQCDMGKKKCIYKSNTRTGLGIIFNYYTKWFRVTAFLITVQQKALVASHKLTNISFQQHVIWPGCVICSN